MTDEERIKQAMEECGLVEFRIVEDEQGTHFHWCDKGRFYWSELCHLGKRGKQYRWGLYRKENRDDYVLYYRTLDEALNQLRTQHWPNVMGYLRQRITELEAENVRLNNLKNAVIGPGTLNKCVEYLFGRAEALREIDGFESEWSFHIANALKECDD